MHLVRQTGVLGRPNEYFNPRSLAETPIHGCQLANTKGRTPNGIAAAKIFAAQMYYAQREINFSQWFPRQVWVWLRRRDKIAQAVSLEIATQTQSWHSSKPAKAEPIYNGERIALRLAFLKSEERWWRRYFICRLIRPLSLWYEDVAADPMSTITTIAKRLHVTLPSNLDLGVPIAVQRSSVNAEWADRFRQEPNPARASRNEINELWERHSWHTATLS